MQNTLQKPQADEWACDGCSTINNVLNDTCGLCNSRRPAHIKPIQEEVKEIRDKPKEIEEEFEFDLVDLKKRPSIIAMETEKKYNVLNGDRCYQMIEERINTVIKKLGCSQEIAYGLLLKNDWDPEKALTEPFVEEKREQPGFIMAWFTKAPEPKSRDELYLEYLQKNFNIDLM